MRGFKPAMLIVAGVGLLAAMAGPVAATNFGAFAFLGTSESKLIRVQGNPKYYKLGKQWVCHRQCRTKNGRQQCRKICKWEW